MKKREFCRTFAELEPVVYLSFEEGESLPEGLRSHGKLYRTDGVIGSGMRFGDGYLTMPCPSMKESFSLMCWVRVDEMQGCERRILMAAGSSSEIPDSRKGISLQITDTDVRFSYKQISSDNCIQVIMPREANVSGKWAYVVIVANRETRMFGISVNFQNMNLWLIPEDTIFPEGEPLYIGQDEMGDTDQKLTGVIDDFCICSKAIDDKDIRRLKEYYQIRGKRRSLKHIMGSPDPCRVSDGEWRLGRILYS